MSLSQADSTDFVTQLDIQDLALFHCRICTALITYHDQDRYAPSGKSPVHSFQPVNDPLDPCAFFTDTSDHVISRLHAGHDMLIDSGSKITTQGMADGLQSYVAPSQSGICMRSATGQVVSPAGEGALPFTIDDGQASLSVLCQHTPYISSNIFSPAETCDTLDCDTYPSLATVAIAQLWFISPSRTPHTLYYVAHTSSICRTFISLPQSTRSTQLSP
jgi:hypothetical protein